MRNKNNHTNRLGEYLIMGAIIAIVAGIIYGIKHFIAWLSN